MSGAELACFLAAVLAIVLGLVLWWALREPAPICDRCFGTGTCCCPECLTGRTMRIERRDDETFVSTLSGIPGPCRHCSGQRKELT